MDEDAYRSNLRLAKARFDAELAEAVREAESRVGHLFHGPLSFLNPLARAAFHFVGVKEARRRAEELFAIHERAIRDVARIGLADAADLHVAEVLAHDDFLARLDPAHPATPVARALVADGFRARLSPLARILFAPAAPSFERLIAGALSRAEADEVLARDFALGRRLVRLAEEHDGLVRGPRAFVRESAAVARDLLQWYEEKSRRDLDAIYATA